MTVTKALLTLIIRFSIESTKLILKDYADISIRLVVIGKMGQRKINMPRWRSDFDNLQ